LVQVVQQAVHQLPVLPVLILFFQLLHQQVVVQVQVELSRQSMVVLAVLAVHQLTAAQAAQLLLPVKVMLEQHQAHLMDHQVAAVEHQQPVLE
jgi:hypothetical protein